MAVLVLTRMFGLNLQTTFLKFLNNLLFSDVFRENEKRLFVDVSLNRCIFYWEKMNKISASYNQ